MPVGFLLSGGLDSSLVCAIAARLLHRPIETYAVGMSTDAIDLKYARQVADYFGGTPYRAGRAGGPGGAHLCAGHL